MLLVLRKIIKSQIAVVICDSIAVHNFNYSNGLLLSVALVQNSIIGVCL